MACRSKLHLIVGTLVVTVAGGCTSRDERYTLVPAEGVLKIDGRPAANIAVQFMPDVMRGARGPTSYATTDAEGKFQLKTYDGRDGTVEGPHIVILADQEEDRPPRDSRRAKPRGSIPGTRRLPGVCRQRSRREYPSRWMCHAPRADLQPVSFEVVGDVPSS